MMNTMRRGFMFVLIVSTLVSFVYAGGQSDGESEESGLELSPPGVFPIVTEPVTLRIMMEQDPLIEDVVDNHATRYMEDLTNVQIEFEAVPSTGFDEKFNLALASGDLPHAFMNYGVPAEVVQNYGNAGSIIRVNELIDEHMVNLQDIFRDDPSMKDLVTDANGNIWGFIETNEDYHGLFPQKLWINSVWLETLGLEMPTTTDELYDVLVAFKNDDPNGNGRKDEIPLTGAAVGWHSQVPSSIMNAFVYYNKNGDVKGLMIEDGEMRFAPITEGWRSGLRYYKRLYDEGLLDSSAFTQHNSELKQLTENPDGNLIGAAPAGFPGVFTQLYGESGRYKDYTAVPPLTGPDGFRTVAYYGTPGHTKGPKKDRFLITSACPYPEVAAKWVDHRYSVEGTLNTTLGKEGEHWRWAEEGEQAIIRGEEALWVRLAGMATGRSSWRLVGCNHNPWDTFKGLQVRRDDMYAQGAIEQWLYEETVDKYDVDIHPDEAPFWLGYYYTPAQAEEVSQLRPAINTYLDESTVRFITGGLDIDNDWDRYVNEYYEIGLQRYLEINQESHDRLGW